MNKTDEILEKVTDIRIKVGKIEEHLKQLNGTVEKHEYDISDMKKMIYKAGGALAVVLVIINVISHFI